MLGSLIFSQCSYRYFLLCISMEGNQSLGLERPRPTDRRSHYRPHENILTGIYHALSPPLHTTAVQFLGETDMEQKISPPFHFAIEPETAFWLSAALSLILPPSHHSNLDCSFLVPKPTDASSPCVGFCLPRFGAEFGNREVKTCIVNPYGQA